MIFRTVQEYHEYIVDAVRSGQAFAFRLDDDKIHILGATLVTDRTGAMDPNDLRDMLAEARRKAMGWWN